jgi:hypothetical protein
VDQSGGDCGEHFPVQASWTLVDQSLSFPAKPQCLHSSQLAVSPPMLAEKRSRSDLDHLGTEIREVVVLAPD